MSKASDYAAAIAAVDAKHEPDDLTIGVAGSFVIASVDHYGDASIATHLGDEHAAVEIPQRHAAALGRWLIATFGGVANA